MCRLCSIGLIARVLNGRENEETQLETHVSLQHKLRAQRNKLMHQHLLCMHGQFLHFIWNFIVHARQTRTKMLNAKKLLYHQHKCDSPSVPAHAVLEVVRCPRQDVSITRKRAKFISSGHFAIFTKIAQYFKHRMTANYCIYSVALKRKRTCSVLLQKD